MARIYIKTYGCSHNMADSETMAHHLEQEGHTVTGLNASVTNREDKKKEFEEMNRSDLVILNTCTVKNPSESKFFSALERITRPVVIAGCIAQSEKDDRWLQEHSAIGVDQVHHIVEVVECTLQGSIVHKLEHTESPADRTFIPISRKNDFIAILPILQGCLGACSYCKTKSARGTLKSHPVASIIKQVRLAKNEGIKEIWVVSEDNGGYGLDIGSSLPELLTRLRKIQGDFKIRIGMINPQYVFKYLDELSELLTDERFYRFLHIPVQSGSDTILQRMNRFYTREQFETVVKTLQSRIPDITISTDIICGYPEETEEDFQKTVDLIEKFRFPTLNISKFYPRHGTPAAKEPQIPTRTVKERSTRITRLFSSFRPNKTYEGSIVTALITEVGKKEGTYIGKTENYRQVLVASNQDIRGRWAKVRISETTRDDMRGTLVETVS